MGGFDFLFSDFLSLHLVNTHTSHSLKAKIKTKTNTMCLALVENHVLIQFILTILSLAPNKCSKNMNIRYIHAHTPPTSLSIHLSVDAQVASMPWLLYIVLQ